MRTRCNRSELVDLAIHDGTLIPARCSGPCRPGGGDAWMGATRQVVRLLLALAALAPVGCFGVTQNPSYFPFYLPTGDIIRTHAKPPGLGYYANSDPHACRLEVTPLEST